MHPHSWEKGNDVFLGETINVGLYQILSLGLLPYPLEYKHGAYIKKSTSQTLKYKHTLIG